MSIWRIAPSRSNRQVRERSGAAGASLAAVQVQASASVSRQVRDAAWSGLTQVTSRDSKGESPVVGVLSRQSGGSKSSGPTSPSAKECVITLSLREESGLGGKPPQV